LRVPRFRITERGDYIRTAKRLFVLGAIFAMCFGILSIRAISFQLKDDEQLERVALRQYRTAVRLRTRRGKILDTFGRELAIDVSAESIYANPMEVNEPVMLAEKLSDLLGVDRRRLLEKLSTRRKFVWVKRKVEEGQARAVKELKMKGVYSMRESRRFYPDGMLAAPVLGAVGLDGEPLGGIELAYNDVLSSRVGVANFKRDARGHLYLSPSGEGETDISNVELTIDKMLQFIAERELTRGVRGAGAKGGTALVVDVSTGAVLAMANLPTFNPNEYSSYPLSQWRNSAIVDAYEPGSTFKVIVIAAALDAGMVTKDEVLDCENGKIRIGRDVVRDAHPYTKLSVADVVKVSSNIGAYKIERRLGMKGVYEAMRSFGFGHKTGIDLPAESNGILTSPNRWSPLQFATIAFGQGIAATPLQVTMAFAAIANGGRLMAPFVVRRVIGATDGRVRSIGTPKVVAHPISPDTAQLMSQMLERVVEKDGTGALAASLEYGVAGKTGTAQKADTAARGYASGKYYSSFVGFAPAHDPRIAVYVGIDNPRGTYYYGGQVAAPVFRRIVEASLKYLKVPGQVVNASQDVLRQLPKEVRDELPTVVRGRSVVLVEAKDHDKEKVDDGGRRSWRIPDLTGLTMRGVLEAAGDADISWSFNGSGVAVRQDPSPGSIVRAGQRCQVMFRPLM
jgi:cell division protein FtsI (penicillin-binding protein 3)